MQKYASEDLIKYIKRFNEKKIMVLGDVIADRFVIADPDRLSREAPVLILRHKKKKYLQVVVQMLPLILPVWVQR